MKNLQFTNSFEVKPDAPDVLNRNAHEIYTTSIAGVIELRSASYSHIQQDDQAEQFIHDIMSTDYTYHARPHCNVVSTGENFGETTDSFALRAGKAIMRTYGADVQIVNISEATENSQTFSQSINYLANKSDGFVIAVSEGADVLAVKSDEQTYAFARALAARELPAILLTNSNAVLLDERQFAPAIDEVQDSSDVENQDKVYA